MKVVRIIFLVIANILFGFMYFSASAYAPLHGDEFTATSSFNPFNDSFFSAEKPTQPSALVPFIPVTNFTNFDLADISDHTIQVFVKDDWYEDMSSLPIWKELNISLKSVDQEDLDEFLNTPTDSVYLVPLALVNPKVRILSINQHNYFHIEDTSEWPVVLSLSRDLDESTITVQDDVYEMSFAGTVVLSRGVAERIRKYGDPFYPWKEVADMIKSADIHINNFKGSITENCEYDGYTLKFCGVPSYLKGMQDAGVDGVSLSGNHIGDYGQAGMKQTVEFLNEYEIAHTGLGSGIDNASKPLVYTFGKGDHQFDVVVVAYNNVFGSAPCANTSTQFGVTCLLNKEDLKLEISSLKSKYDVVIVYPNWGPEYTHYPHQEAQVEWGRTMIESGADLVIGDQAHWVQTMEVFQDSPIFYGLGNFVFDQMWSEKTREGLYLRAYFGHGTLLAIEPKPIKIYDYAQPRIETGKSGQEILEYLALPIQEQITY